MFSTIKASVPIGGFQNEGGPCLLHVRGLSHFLLCRGILGQRWKWTRSDIDCLAIHLDRHALDKRDVTIR